MEHSEESHGLYRCLWCDPKQQESPSFRDLRVWFKIIGVESSWVYDYCGMCDGCVASEWKEYRTDFRDPAIKHEVERRAYDNWSSVLASTVDRIRLQCGVSEEVRLVHEGSGGKRRMVRKLRKQYWSQRNSV